MAEMLFRVLGGAHRQKTTTGTKVFKKGQVLKSSVNLVKIFKNKFERVSPDEVSSEVAGKKARPVLSKQDLANIGDENDTEEEQETTVRTYSVSKEEAKTIAAANHLGKNVTGSYKEFAIPLAVYVFRNEEHQYAIIDGMSGKVINEDKPLQKVEVRPFLADLVTKSEE